MGAPGGRQPSPVPDVALGESPDLPSRDQRESHRPNAPRLAFLGDHRTVTKRELSARGTGDRRRPAFAGTLETPFLPIEAPQDLRFPALLDPLDPFRGDVSGGARLHPRTQQGVDVRVRRPLVPAMLMDREHALDSTGSAAEGLLNGVPDGALDELRVEPCEALGRVIVHGQNETEVDGPLQAARVLGERPLDRGLVAAECTVARADPV